MRATPIGTLADMLPNEFEWRRWPNGRGLFLSGAIVAKLLLHLEPEAIVELHPNELKCRRVHFTSEAVALKYAEAWANKWEQELRAAYGRRTSDGATKSRVGHAHG